jgi:hypothetical protein
LVKSPRYQAIPSNKVKAEVVSQVIPSTRQVAVAQAIKDDPRDAFRARYDRVSKRERVVIGEWSRQARNF